MSSDAPLMLSVSGMRGWVGKTMTPIAASRFAAAFGSWLRDNAKKRGRDVPHVVVGRDSRPSGAMIEMSVS